MKAKFLLLFGICAVLFFTLPSFNAENSITEVETTIIGSERVLAVYDGSDDRGYSFIIKVNGQPETIIFPNVDNAILSEFNLDSKSFVGSSFYVTYEISTQGNDSEAVVKVITKLERCRG